jgi:hypothetical protein
MNIQLKDITSENFMECVLLKSIATKERPLFEEHVASNAFSLAQAKVESEWLSKAIYSHRCFSMKANSQGPGPRLHPHPNLPN